MAQKTDAQLTTEANVIKNETTAGANTATRVGEMLNDIIDSKLNNEDAEADYLAIDGANANEDVDLGNYSLNAKSLHVKGTGGTGHIGLKHQSSNITANGSESSIGANSSGNPVWKNDGNTIETIMTNTQAGPIINGVVAKTELVDNDQMLLADSAASNASKKITWANIKASLADATASVKGVLKLYTGTGSNTDGTMTQSAIVSAINAAKIGLWNDRGVWDASGGSYPATGGSGTAGAIMKGNVWTISVAGTLGGVNVVEVGDVIRSLVDTPGQTNSNWVVMQNNIGYTAENSANKGDTINGNETSSISYPSFIGVTNWIKFAFITWLAPKGRVDNADRFVLSDLSDSYTSKTLTWSEMINNIPSGDANNALSIGTDTRLYYQEWRHLKAEQAGLVINLGAGIMVGAFNGIALDPKIAFNSIQVFFDGILQAEISGKIVWNGTDLTWGFTGVGDVTIHYQSKI